MEARLASSILVGALLRQAEREGGFGAVLERGDATAGSILVVLTERGASPRLFERVLQPDSRYVWQMISNQVADKSQDVSQLVARRRKFDPDLWVVELDVPSAERFAAEMNSF